MSETEKKPDAFSIQQPHATNGKEIFLTGPDDSLRVMVDCDDVEKLTMACGLRKILAILNDQWDKPEWAHLNWEPTPDWEPNDDRWFDYGEDRYDRGQEVLRELGVCK